MTDYYITPGRLYRVKGPKVTYWNRTAQTWYKADAVTVTDLKTNNEYMLL